ncbi:MAG: hypothetical protein CVU05_08295 [Bacteroidetes bacterium HGW-Bacteroidetes-21]|jgi:Tfp pilus assembly protein PilN|nr:MAG: hypothetical protein CVU05_08295 [Bacteroidetes bacterium HGW-Bacteroidetes-21]
MFSRLKNSEFVKGNSAVGISCFFQPDGGIIASLSILTKKKKKIEIVKKHENITDIEELVKLIPVSFPIFLIVDGKGVITRKMRFETEYTDEIILNQILPNSNSDEFFFEKYSAEDGFIFASVVRVQQLNSICEAIGANGRIIINVSLGPLILNGLLPYIKNYFEFIELPFQKLVCKNNSIVEIIKDSNQNGEAVVIGNENIESNILLSFSAAFSYLTNYSESEKLPALIQKNANEYLYKRILLLAGWASLVLLFMLLLSSFLIFDKYRALSNDYSEKLKMSTDLISKLNVLKNELSTKKDFFKDFIISESTKLSFFSDQIAATVPETISLTVLDINPLSKKLKEEQIPEFYRNTIVIAGVTPNSTILNDWIKTLQKYTWVSQINIINYSQENANVKGAFKIELQII